MEDVHSIIKPPKKCSGIERDQFIQFVRKFGKVNPNYVPENVEGARLLAFCYIKNELVGTAAVKVPRPTYWEKIFRKAGVSHERSNYELEYGYAATKEKYRGNGICSRLTKNLLDQVTHLNLFSTTANEIMEHVLRENGFSRIGNQYMGEETKDCIHLFIRNKV